MTKNSYTISEFSKLTGINTDNLRFYDREGLLVPERREDNGYRSYSIKQLSTAYLITTLRSLDVGLEEIREYATSRNPEVMNKLFKKHDQRISQEIARLKETRDIMKLYISLANEAKIEDDYVCKVQYHRQENYFKCEDVLQELSNEEAEIQAFAYAWEHKVNLVCPLGIIIDTEVYNTSQKFRVKNYYFKSTKTKNDFKPEGYYAVFIGKYDPWVTMQGIQFLFDYIEKEKLTMTGEVYVEYVLDHVAEQNTEDYCVKIEVQIKEK